MFGWFRKQRARKEAKRLVAAVKDARARGEGSTMTQAERIKQLEAEGYTNQGTLQAEGPMKGATIMVRDPTKERAP